MISYSKLTSQSITKSIKYQRRASQLSNSIQAKLTEATEKKLEYNNYFSKASLNALQNKDKGAVLSTQNNRFRVSSPSRRGQLHYKKRRRNLLKDSKKVQENKEKQNQRKKRNLTLESKTVVRRKQLSPDQDSSSPSKTQNRLKASNRRFRIRRNSFMSSNNTNNNSSNNSKEEGNMVKQSVREFASQSEYHQGVRSNLGKIKRATATNERLQRGTIRRKRQKKNLIAQSKTRIQGKNKSVKVKNGVVYIKRNRRKRSPDGSNSNYSGMKKGEAEPSTPTSQSYQLEDSMLHSGTPTRKKFISRKRGLLPKFSAPRTKKYKSNNEIMERSNNQLRIARIKTPDSLNSSLVGSGVLEGMMSPMNFKDHLPGVPEYDMSPMTPKNDGMTLNWAGESEFGDSGSIKNFNTSFKKSLGKVGIRSFNNFSAAQKERMGAGGGGGGLKSGFWSKKKRRKQIMSFTDRVEDQVVSLRERQMKMKEQGKWAYKAPRIVIIKSGSQEELQPPKINFLGD